MKRARWNPSEGRLQNLQFCIMSVRGSDHVCFIHLLTLSLCSSCRKTAVFRQHYSLQLQVSHSTIESYQNIKIRAGTRYIGIGLCRPFSWYRASVSAKNGRYILIYMIQADTCLQRVCLPSGGWGRLGRPMEQASPALWGVGLRPPVEGRLRRPHPSRYLHHPI